LSTSAGLPDELYFFIHISQNQQALLEISKAHGKKAQLKKVALLAPPSKDRQDKSVKLGAGGKAKANESGRRGKHSKSPEHPEHNL
jgi:hypothetical protein